jgi:ankyrin repeat protein
MILFKIGNFDNVDKVSFFLTYTDFNHIDYNDNNFLHHYAMKENIFSYFKDYVYKDNLPSELFEAKNKDGFTPYELALEMGNVKKAEHIKNLQEYYK